jgi:pilus assembly protein Flp/PilA
MGTPDKKGPPMLTFFRQASAEFLRREDGPTAVEYAVMLALIVVVCIAAIAFLGSGANSTFSNVALNTATGS